jgi:5'-3' exonuclease
VGDTVDNVPGVQKVGPKTAVKLLLEYGSLDNLMANADQVKGVVGENLRKAVDWLPTGRQLLKIRTDCDLNAYVPELPSLESIRLAPPNEADLLAFEQGLIDRFGPLPDSVKELANTLRLQWLGKRIGFEKISLKKNVLRGYFVSNQQSAYFESEAFGKVLAYVQTRPGACNLKEVKGVLRIAFEGVNDLKQAIYLLNELLD